MDKISLNGRIALCRCCSLTNFFFAIPSCSNLTEFFFKRQTVCFPSGYNDLYFNSTFVCKIVKVSVQDQLSLLKLFFGILPCTLRVGCPKYSKHLIFDLIWTFRILRIQDLNIFELWISVFASIRFELRIFRISRIYSTPWLGLIFEWNWAELAVLISW